MLTRLIIKDFALLRDAELNLSTGFTAVTGETGSGKSLLVGAIAFLVGGKPNIGIVRDGAEKAVVVGAFTTANGDQSSLRRELMTDGRTLVFYNNRRIRLKELAAIVAPLVDITAQRSFSHLLDPVRHLDFLDGFSKLDSERNRLRQYQSEYISLDRRIRALFLKRKEFLHRRDLIEFQLNEMDVVDPHSGEDDELDAEIHRLEHFEELHESGSRLGELLIGDEMSVESLLSEGSNLLQRLAELDSALVDLPGEFESARITLKETARRVLERCHSIGYEAEGLEQLRERRHELAGLARRFGGNLKSLLELREILRQELDIGDNTEYRLVDLRKQVNQLTAEWCDLARKVGEVRRKKSVQLEKEIIASLTKLGMKNATFEVRFTRISDPKGLFEEDGQRFRLDDHGAETAEFYLSANPGIEPRPLTHIASGGELSRLLLSLKDVLPAGNDEAFILFDEIDTGVSGRVANLMGLKLRELSQQRQLMAVTHLPQIAGLADQHLCVVKRTDRSGMTEAAIIELTGEQRIREIASLLSGGDITDAAVEQARHLFS